MFRMLLKVEEFFAYIPRYRLFEELYEQERPLPANDSYKSPYYGITKIGFR